MRGSLYGEDDERIPDELGVETIPWIDLAEMSASDFASSREDQSRGKAGVPVARCRLRGRGALSRHRYPGDRRSPSFEAIQYLRSLAGIEFVGYDVVEVAPQYDGPGQVTALFAAGAIFEMLSMVAKQRRSA